MKKTFIGCLTLTAILLFACSKEQGGEGGGSSTQTGKRQTLTIATIDDVNQGKSEINSHKDLLSTSILTPIAGTYVQLDESVTHEEKPVYPRFIKTDAGDYLMFYHYGTTSWAGNECEYMRSTDLVNWTWEKKLFSVFAITDCEGKSNKRAYAGANMVKLANGDILVVASTRAISNYRDRNADNGLAIRISKDNGHTWGEEQIVYVGTNWEPMPVVLPSGQIQIYYTDSKKLTPGAFGAGNEVISTGSSYIWSDDNGKTWQGGSNNAAEHSIGFAQVRYEYGSQIILTDQMPAVIALNNSTKLAAAAESFIGGQGYTSYISLAYSGDNYDWGTPDTKGVVPEDRVDNFVRGCAPYLVQFPSGETVLAYNESNVFYMMQGNAEARNFGAARKVFDKDLTTGKGFWGTLYCPDSHRMVAGVGGSGAILQVGQFYLNHAIKASTHSVTMDGNNTEWKNTDEALYLCSLGDAKAFVRCSKDSENLYFIFDVKESEISKDDYVQLFLSDPSKTTVGSHSIRVKASYTGLKTSGNYAGGWKETETGATAVASYDGTPGYHSDTDNGYIVEISVPLSSLNIVDGKLLINASLFDIKNGGEDALVSTAGKSTEGWICVTGL